jgi:hypothetical protein
MAKTYTMEIGRKPAPKIKDRRCVVMVNSTESRDENKFYSISIKTLAEPGHNSGVA